MIFEICLSIIAALAGLNIGLLLAKSDMKSSGVLTEEIERKYNLLITIFIIAEWFVLIVYLALKC
jgi:hypothetical protein